MGFFDTTFVNQYRIYLRYTSRPKLNIMRSLTITLLGLLMIVGCASDGEVQEEMGVINIDPEFQVFVDEFVEEAARRGQEIDFSDTGLTVQFSDLALDGANGRCFFASHLIEIDKADWFSFSPNFRSFLLFHELGHCELRRGHTNSQFDDLSWMSIMKGDPFDGTDGRIPVPYFGFRREYYIDELFNPNTPEPAWARASFSRDTELPKELIESESDVTRINSLPRLSDEDYEIDVEFDLIEDPGVWTTLEWGAQGANYYITVFPDFGFIIGVRDAGIDIPLHYRLNYEVFNGRLIDNITIRRHDDFEQIFINGEQFFLLDMQERLDFVTLSAVRGDQRVNFDIEDFSVSRITE